MRNIRGHLQMPQALQDQFDGKCAPSEPVRLNECHATSPLYTQPGLEIAASLGSFGSLGLDFPEIPFATGAVPYDLPANLLPDSKDSAPATSLAPTLGWATTAGLPTSAESPLFHNWQKGSSGIEVLDGIPHSPPAKSHGKEGPADELHIQPQRSSSADNAAECDLGGDHSSPNDKLAVKHTRRAEQNRRAQAKFRQRKKDKLSILEKQLANMSMHLDRVTHEKQAIAEKALQLQQVVEKKNAQLAALNGAGKAIPALEELTSAFWEMVVELKRGKQDLNYSRDNIQDMVYGLLNWRSLDLRFIRKEIVAQLVQCVKQGGEVVHSPTNRWLNRLVTAYNKMVHRCGETNPLAFRTFLSLQLPEQQGLLADHSFWRRVVDAGGLTLLQKKQLMAAHKQLMDKMQHLMSQRDVVGLVAGTSCGREPVLNSMDQAKEVLDLHEHILKEEQLAVFNFRTSVGLSLEPIQQAKLMISSFPFALDTLAICAVLAENRDWLPEGMEDVSFFSNLPTNSPFQALASNSMPCEDDRLKHQATA